MAEVHWGRTVVVAVVVVYHCLTMVGAVEVDVDIARVVGEQLAGEGQLAVAVDVLVDAVVDVVVGDVSEILSKIC